MKVGLNSSEPILGVRSTGDRGVNFSIFWRIPKITYVKEQEEEEA